MANYELKHVFHDTSSGKDLERGYWIVEVKHLDIPKTAPKSERFSWVLYNGTGPELYMAKLTVLLVHGNMRVFKSPVGNHKFVLRVGGLYAEWLCLDDPDTSIGWVQHESAQLIRAQIAHSVENKITEFLN